LAKGTSRTFATGKLPTHVLERLLAGAPIRDKRVLVGPRVGLDAAVIDCGSTCLVLKSDPITFAADRIGWYAVNINANDVAAMGATPKWFLATLLLPEQGSTTRLVEKIFDDLAAACDELDISLCGGHTEVTAGLDRPILCGQLVGEVDRKKLVVPKRVRIGDSILLARGIAIEGTAVAARERRKLVEEKLGKTMARRARRFLDQPGISVVRAALTANSAGRIHAMHDPTEGGLAMGLYEVAKASSRGMLVDRDAVPVYPETAALCETFGLDAFRLLASGALIIVCAARDTENIIRALEREDISVVEIGSIKSAQSGVVLKSTGARRKIAKFEVDEITKFLADS